MIFYKMQGSCRECTCSCGAGNHCVFINQSPKAHRRRRNLYRETAFFKVDVRKFFLNQLGTAEAGILIWSPVSLKFFKFTGSLTNRIEFYNERLKHYGSRPVRHLRTRHTTQARHIIAGYVFKIEKVAVACVWFAGNSKTT